MEKHLGYIVEKVVGNHRQQLCFDGSLCVECLPVCFQPPFTLQHLEVVQIKPGHSGVCRTFEGHACCKHDTNTVEITLACCVMDCCGRRAKGTAKLQLEVCGVPCAGNVRRGAKIEVLSACPSGTCVFELRLAICLYTIVSRGETIVCAKPCRDECNRLPLYPQPVPRLQKEKCR